MAENYDVNLSNVRQEINNTIHRLQHENLTERDFLRPRSIFNQEAYYPSEMIDLYNRLGIRRIMENYTAQMNQATQLKRMGDLAGANLIYTNIFREQSRLDKAYIWPWCKIMILEKNFPDLELLLQFLHAYNARNNLVALKAGGEFSDYREWNNLQPELSFEVNTSLYLRECCDSALASKDEVQWRFAQYGGSALWQTYSLNDREYENFLKYFSLEKAGLRHG